MKKPAIDHFKKYRFVQSLAAGPGGDAVFVVQQANLAENRYDADLWLLRGGETRQLTYTGEVDRFWWAGERAIVFPRLVREEDKRRREAGFPLTVLYRLELDAPGEAAEWLRLEQELEDLLFLPDGGFLFVAVQDDAKAAALAKAGGDEAKAREKLEELRSVEVITGLPVWENGDGFTGGRRHRLWRWDGAQALPLVDGKTDAGMLRLSPSGKCAFFVSRRYDSIAPLEDRLMCLEVGSGEIEDLSGEGAFVHHAYAVVDDETLLVFGTGMETFGINQNGAFYRLDVPTRERHVLYDGGLYNGDDGIVTDLKMSAAPRWAVLDGRVYWNTTLDDSSHLMCIDPATGDIARVTQQPGAVHELAVAEGRLLFVGMRGLSGQELYEVDSNGNERQISCFNTPLEEAYTLQMPQALSFENSEGTLIQGWVITPADWEEGQTYPAILSIHGGPKMTFGGVVMHEMQYWAAQGFGVLYCNPTGSDGRGDEFADLRGRYGLIDYDDIMLFVEAALDNHAWIDDARLGVTGGSYGGFMTNWIVGHTARFRAAASQRGIANWLTMALTSDIGLQFVPDQLGAQPLDDPDTLWDASPLKYAPAAVTPTLFIHSEEDYRCWMVEALQMYTALHAKGVDTRMCVFRGENHELSRSGKPKNRVRRLREITEWFAGYLG